MLSIPIFIFLFLVKKSIDIVLSSSKWMLSLLSTNQFVCFFFISMHTFLLTLQLYSNNKIIPEKQQKCEAKYFVSSTKVSSCNNNIQARYSSKAFNFLTRSHPATTLPSKLFCSIPGIIYVFLSLFCLTVK